MLPIGPGTLYKSLLDCAVNPGEANAVLGPLRDVSTVNIRSSE